MKIGERVGAIISADKDSVELAGYGTYEGEEIPPEGINFMGISLNKLQRVNPKIKLDNGHIIWGCQCWFQSEETIKSLIGNRKVNIISPSYYENPN